MLNLSKHLKDYTSCANPKLNLYLNMLHTHGEVQIVTTTGAVHTTHLGDYGEVTDGYFAYRTKEGEVNVIFPDQIQSLNTHRGYQDA